MYKFLIITFILLFITGCGGKEELSKNEQNYTLENNKNHVLLGPIRNAKIEIFKLNDRKTPIFETTTNNLGGFNVDSLDAKDDEVLLVKIQGGEDIDINDDKLKDEIPTPHKGILYGFARKKDLENAKVNITILSQLLYMKLEKLLPKDGNINEDFNIENSDFFNMIKLFSSSIIKDNDNKSYEKLISFSPLSNNSKQNLQFDFNKLKNIIIKIHKNDINNNSQLEKEITQITQIPNLRYETLLDIRKKTKLKLLIPKNVKEISSSNNLLSLSKKDAFVKKDESFFIKLDKIETNYKILFWKGCDRVSNDKTKCYINGSYEDRVIFPFIVPKEIKLYENIVIRDISNAKIEVNNNIVKISNIASLDNNTSTILSQIKSGDILVHKYQRLFGNSDKPINFAKVVSISNSNNEYQIEIEKIPLFEIIKDGYFTTQIDQTDPNIKLISRTLKLPNGSIIKLDPNQRVTINLEFNKNRVNAKIIDINKEERVFSFDKNISNIIIEGNVSIEPSYDAGTVWEKGWGIIPYSIKQVYFDANTQTRGNIKISYEKNITIDKNNTKEIGKLGPYTQEFTILGIPVTTTELLTFEIGLDAKIKGKVEIGANAFVNPKLNLGWINGSGAYTNLNLTNDFNYRYYANMKASLDTFSYFNTKPAFYLYFFGLYMNNKVGPYATADANLTLEQSSDNFPENIKDMYSDINITAGLYGEIGLKYKGEIRADIFDDKCKIDLCKDILKRINNKLKNNKYTNYNYIFWNKEFKYNYANAQHQAKDGYIEINTNAYGGYSENEKVCKFNIDNNNIECKNGNSIEFKINNGGDKKISYYTRLYKENTPFDITMSGDINATLSKNGTSIINLEITLKDINHDLKSGNYMKLATINFCEDKTTISQNNKFNRLTTEIKPINWTFYGYCHNKKSYDIYLSTYSQEEITREKRIENFINNSQIEIPNGSNINFTYAGNPDDKPDGFNLYLVKINKNGEFESYNLISTINKNNQTFKLGKIESYIANGLLSPNETYALFVKGIINKKDEKTGIIKANELNSNSKLFKFSIESLGENEGYKITPLQNNIFE